MLQADDLVLQTLVQSLLVFDRLRLDLQLLERSSRQELTDLALNENNTTKISLVLPALKPATNMSLDDDGLAVTQQLEVTGACKVSANAGLQQYCTVLVASVKWFKDYFSFENLAKTTRYHLAKTKLFSRVYFISF